MGLCERCRRPFCSECRTDSIQDRQYCSTRCRAELERSAGAATATPEEMLRGRDRPFRTGWGLWFRASAGIAAYTAPAALGMALLESLRTSSGPDAFRRVLALPPLGVAAWLALGAIGMALTAVVLSRRHRRAFHESVYGHTAGRFLSWSATWLLATLASVVGSLLLLIPGLIAGIRLFWADEFALTHGDAPLAALRRSWEFTRGRFGSIFGFQWLAGFASYLTLMIVVAVNALFNTAVAASGVPASPALDVFVSAVGYALAFVTYGGLHANELVYFYGLRAEDELLGEVVRVFQRAGTDARGQTPVVELFETCLRIDRNRIVPYAAVRRLGWEGDEHLVLHLENDVAIVAVGSLTPEDRAALRSELEQRATAAA